MTDQRDLAEAHRALQADEKVYGPDHPRIAEDANNIGQILQEQRDLAGALEYTRRALKIAEKVFGPDHSNVATVVNNLGLILKEQGDLAAALEYCRRVLKIDERVLAGC